jgi:hypothetical protein
MRLVALTLIITVTGCADLQRQAEDYDTSVLARFLSVCDGEMWFSNEVDEKLCVRRSNWHQNTFLLTQDAAEYWTDFFATYTPELGILYSLLDDDTTEKWFRAADQYMRKTTAQKPKLWNLRGSTPRWDLYSMSNPEIKFHRGRKKKSPNLYWPAKWLRRRGKNLGNIPMQQPGI